MKKGNKPDRRKLLAFYLAGRQSLLDDGDHVEYGALEGLAKKQGFNPQTLLDARQFARRIGTQKHFDRFMVDAKEVGAVIGMTFCIRLLAAADSDWNDLIRLAGENKWGANELARQIRLRYRPLAEKSPQRLGRPTGAYKTTGAYDASLIACCKRCESLLRYGLAGSDGGLPEPVWPAARTLAQSIKRFLVAVEGAEDGHKQANPKPRARIAQP